MQQTAQPKPAPAPAAPKPKPAGPPPEFQEGAIATMDAAAITAVLKDPKATEFQKAKAAMRAGELGAKEAIPALAAMLGDEKMNVYGRYGLEPIADPAVDEALRAALGKLKGNLQIGVVNSIGKRRDAKAHGALVRLLYGADPQAARAAAAAIGAIGNEMSMKELTAALAKAQGAQRVAVADAALVCAERLIADGKREQGLALYSTLTAPATPKAQRLAAMNGILREETLSINAR